MENAMDAMTITILIGFLALAGGQIRTATTLNKRLDDMNKEMNRRFDDVNKRFDDTNRDVNKRFDDTNRDMNKRFDDTNRDMNTHFDGLQQQVGELRERMAKLEGSLDGFLAGRRDRDAA